MASLAAGNVLDRSGYGNDAQVKGAVGTAPGIYGGQGIAFDGARDELAINDRSLTSAEVQALYRKWR